jgi:hypothetical protein
MEKNKDLHYVITCRGVSLCLHNTAGPFGQAETTCGKGGALEAGKVGKQG